LSFDAIGWQRGFRFHALRIVASLQLVAQHKTVRSRIGVTAATACFRNFHVLGGPDIWRKFLQYEVVAAALGARHSYWPVFHSHRCGWAPLLLLLKQPQNHSSICRLTIMVSCSRDAPLVERSQKQVYLRTSAF
jgi:hypothetical protein